MPVPDFQESFVDRDSFYQRRCVVKNLEYVLARLGVRIHARRNDNCLRAQRTRLTPTHRGPDPTRFGFVARGQHYSAAHDDGPADQIRLVSLFDGGVERVEIGMQDRGATGPVIAASI